MITDGSFDNSMCKSTLTGMERRTMGMYEQNWQAAQTDSVHRAMMCLNARQATVT